MVRPRSSAAMVPSTLRPPFRQATLGELEGEGIVNGLLKLSQLLHADHILVGALVALAHQGRQLLAQQVPRPLNAHCTWPVTSDLSCLSVLGRMLSELLMRMSE